MAPRYNPLSGRQNEEVYRKRHALAQGFDPDRTLPEYEPTAAQRPVCGRCGGRTFAVPHEGRRYAWHCLPCGWEGADFLRRSERPRPGSIAALAEGEW